jgi:predicted DNA-binding ribbon-helix-helix protein
MRSKKRDSILVPWYHSTNVEDAMAAPSKQLEIERIQTGVRMERRILKVLKGLAEYKDMSLGNLLEGIVLHAFEGKSPFNAATIRKIAELKGIYELDLDASASHRLKEKA